jgi:hypothetical protein
MVSNVHYCDNFSYLFPLAADVKYVGEAKPYVPEPYKPAPYAAPAPAPYAPAPAPAPYAPAPAPYRG